MTSNRTKIGEPMFGGKECDGNETRTEVCNMNSCPGTHFIFIGIALTLILDLILSYMQWIASGRTGVNGRNARKLVALESNYRVERLTSLHHMVEQNAREMQQNLKSAMRVLVQVHTEHMLNFRLRYTFSLHEWRSVCSFYRYEYLEFVISDFFFKLIVCGPISENGQLVQQSVVQGSKHQNGIYCFQL